MDTYAIFPMSFTEKGFGFSGESPLLKGQHKEKKERIFMIPSNERAKTYIEKGQHKTSHKHSKIFVLAILGGMFSAFGCIGYHFGKFYGGGATGEIVGALVFPIGIILTTMAGAELFTGNCLLSLPLLSGHVKLKRVILNLALVYAGNLIGSIAIALITAGSGVLEPLSGMVIAHAAAKAGLNPLYAFLRGLLCNMLITLGVWGAEASKSAPGKILSVYFPVVVFVLAGFENANTNMYFLSAGIFTSMFYEGSASALTILLGFITNLIPVSLGNFVGGMTIGALYKHAHVEDELFDDKTSPEEETIEEYIEEYIDDYVDENEKIEN